MLCTNLQSINRVCGPTSGGISRVWIFDPYDFNFTQGSADVDTGAAAKYSAAAVRVITGTTATATVTRSTTTVGTIAVVSGGSGYASAPTVTISGGGGTGATATAVLTGGVVTAINVTAPGTGYTTNPTATIAAPTGAAVSGAAMLPVKFQKEEAEYKFAQSRKGCSVKYEHSLEFQLADLDQSITNWNAAVDAAGCCCGVGLVIQLKSGKIFVAGERYVNDDEIAIALELTQDGSSGTSGKLLDDFNGETVVIKGNHSRKLYEYSGTVQSIIDLETAA